MACAPVRCMAKSMPHWLVPLGGGGLVELILPVLVRTTSEDAPVGGRDLDLDSRALFPSMGEGVCRGSPEPEEKPKESGGGSGS
jgi:hypothetical protein